MPLLSYSVSSGALGSPDLLLSYSTISLASHINIILKTTHASSHSIINNINQYRYVRCTYIEQRRQNLDNSYRTLLLAQRKKEIQIQDKDNDKERESHRLIEIKCAKDKDKDKDKDKRGGSGSGSGSGPGPGGHRYQYNKGAKAQKIIRQTEKDTLKLVSQQMEIPKPPNSSEEVLATGAGGQVGGPYTGLHTNTNTEGQGLGQGHGGGLLTNTVRARSTLGSFDHAEEGFIQGGVVPLSDILDNKDNKDYKAAQEAALNKTKQTLNQQNQQKQHDRPTSPGAGTEEVEPATTTTILTYPTGNPLTDFLLSSPHQATRMLAPQVGLSLSLIFKEYGYCSILVYWWHLISRGLVH